jgi:hypothetical protein
MKNGRMKNARTDEDEDIAVGAACVLGANTRAMRLTGDNLGPQDAELLVAAVGQHAPVTALELSRCTISSEAASALALLLQAVPSLCRSL